MVVKNYDWAGLCISKSGPGEDRRLWKSTFKKVECDHATGDPRRIKLTCEAQSRSYRSTEMTPEPAKPFYYHCDEGFVYQSISLGNTLQGGLLEEVSCVDTQDVVRETVRSNTDAAHGKQDVHCGFTLQIPGSQYRAAPGQKSIDLVLTEQVNFPDGRPYPAPLLYIHDKTSRWGFDPARRMGASVASAQIQIGVHRGQFHQREFEFCMQMLPRIAISSVIFTYSFFRVELHHGRLPGSCNVFRQSTRNSYSRRLNRAKD